MTLKEKKDLYNKYLSYITNERAQKFERVSELRTKYITVVLENINQTHNISAALRSCDCFGLQDTYIIENTHKYQENESISKGASKWLNIFKYNNQLENNTKKCLLDLKDQGYSIVATSPRPGDFNITDLPINNKLALIFGTEDKGISEDVILNADYFVQIPMFGFTESFNISVSVAISLYELTNRLRKSAYNRHLTEEELIDLKLNWLAKSTEVSELRNFIKS